MIIKKQLKIMRLEDKIYSKIKDAASIKESDSFPGMNKVWESVTNRLETKALKKENKLWKKWTIAASVALLGIIMFQFLKETNPSKTSKPEPVIDTNNHTLVVPKNIINENKTVKPKMIPMKDKEESFNAIKNSSDATAIVISENCEIPLKEEFNDKIMIQDEPAKIQDERLEKLNVSFYNTASSADADFTKMKRIFEAQRVDAGFLPIKNKELNLVPNTVKDSSVLKSEDLVVVNGYLSKKELKEINWDDYEISLELKNPLYIINGERFTEAALFGKTPTSTYAPLKKQKITEIRIIYPDEALRIYGEIGKNGIVILTVKK